MELDSNWFSGNVEQPEIRLWRAVIAQMLTDATGGKCGVKDGTHAQDKYQATIWFERRQRDFRDVCIMAGFEPDQIWQWSMEFLKASDDTANKV